MHPSDDPTETILRLPAGDPLWSAAGSPPKEIRLEGRRSAFALLERLPSDGLAVVGTRAPDRRALFLLSETIRRLRGSPRIVISGLARGIDSAAHEAALAAGLPTIAVLGCGIERTYPPENRALRRRIVAAGGLIVSEFPPAAEARPSFFIQRNRLIAGLARATWLVQSGYRSGALNTASRALKIERAIYATPAFPGDPAFLGNQNLLARYPRHVRALWGPEDLAEVWLDLVSTVHQNRRREGLDDPARTDGLSAEIERALRQGKDLLAAVTERSRRTGENVDELLARLERPA